MNRTLPIVSHEPYHLYNRGNNRQTIFHDESDFWAFQKKLEATAQKYSVVVAAYVLMSNHFHLLTVQQPGGSIPEMMEALGTSTAKRYNAKYKHSGHLFQGPYKYALVMTDQGIAEVARYIHLNPVRAGLVNLPEEWPWSDFRCHVGGASVEGFLEPGIISGQENLLPRDYVEYVRQGIDDIETIKRALFESDF